MRVLLVVPEYPPDFGGGIVTFYRDLAPALIRAGCDVTVLRGSAYVHGDDRRVVDGVDVSTLESDRYAKWLAHFFHFGMFPDLHRHLAASFALHEQARGGEGFDAVEVTDWGMLFLPWMISSQAPVLVQLHGSTGQIALHEPQAGHEAEGAVALLLEKAALAESSALASHSMQNSGWWQRTLGRPVLYEPPPMSLPPFADLPASTDVWLAVGRIQLWKGPQVACGAWARMGKAAPHLHWAGRDTRHGATGGSTSRWLGDSFQGTWGGSVEPVGQLSPAEVARRMRLAKAVVVPSTWDVFNLAAAEAMALGKVVVVSSGAGSADMVDHGVNGFTFQNGHEDELAELVRRVQQMNSAEMTAMGQAAACTVKERLNPDRIAQQKLVRLRAVSAPTTGASVWLREWLAPASGRAPLAFLDALPLKDLSRYVAHRGVHKALRRRAQE